MGVRKPTHHSESVEQGLGDGGGYFPDEKSAEAYASKAVESDYGRDRLRAVRSLIAKADIVRAPTVVDFGGGDGSFLRDLALNAGQIHLIDVSPHMLEAASALLDGNELEVLLGSVDQLANLGDATADVVLCINTLGYLEADDQERFFVEAHRILKPGGKLVIMTGNELLDLYAINSGTSHFFKHNFSSDISALLVHENHQRWLNADRANPLAFSALLQSFGFREEAQSFSQWHTSPPGLAVLEADGDIARARLEARDHAFDANLLAEGERWQALFRCSMFASLAVKA